MTSTKFSDPVEVISVGTVIPAKVSIRAALHEGQSSGYIKILLGPSNPADPSIAIGELIFHMDSNTSNNSVTVDLSVSIEGEINVEIKQDVTQLIIGNLLIPISL